MRGSPTTEQYLRPSRPGRCPSNLLYFHASQQPVSLYSTGTYTLHDFYRFIDKPNLTCLTLTLTSATALPREFPLLLDDHAFAEVDL
jgi:hypothetical protein